MKELLILDDCFQEYLKDGDYSFVAPEDDEICNQFLKKAEEISETSGSGTLHDVLSDRVATRKALSYFPHAKCDIFVARSTDAEDFIAISLGTYIETRNIKFP